MKINIGGLNINYETYGDKNRHPLVLLHGWGCCIATYKSVAEALKDDFFVVVPDLAGFGESDEPPEPWKIEDYAENVIAFLNALDIKNPTIAGHSHGGRTAIYMTGALGYKANKLILIDSAGVAPKRSLKYYIKTYIYKFNKKILLCSLWKSKTKNIYEKYINSKGSADYKAASPVMRGTLSNVVNVDLCGYMMNIKAPTILYWGENDTATPISDAYKMEKLIPDAGLIKIPGAGHYSFLESFNQFIAVVKEFLKKEI